MKILSTAAAIALASAPAFAGSLSQPVEEPVLAAPVAPVLNFGNDWSGAYVGAQVGYGNMNSDGAVNGSGNGPLGGVHAGYQYDMGSLVLGGELDYNAADISLDNNNGSIDKLARLRGKVGYDLGRTMVYGTAGAAYGEINLAGTSYDENGYTVGAGVDYMLTDNVILGGELNYQKFTDVGGTAGNDVDATTVQAKVSYKF
ncbi:outer membrane protein [Brevirhabdus sp.]|uniref:outer membrane protein n=1 Tax=Brevirhabdus sp. TaxID=2004514 RepID=UPI00405891E2